jgi:predicted nucleotidyltransferase component of viral defense system
VFNSLQQREIFHLEFLRWFGRKVSPANYALKGGVNMRFFFGSGRYSEDMDLDIEGLRVDLVQDTVLNIFQSKNFIDNFKPYGIQDIGIPDIIKAKQTETTQRFKVHLITYSGEDLFTKVEFSRRGLQEGIKASAVPNNILHAYKMPPIIVPHYNEAAAILQKINALASRPVVQARDIFDLYILSPLISSSLPEAVKIPEKTELERAYENLFSVTFGQFRDSVIIYLAPDEQNSYNSSFFWDEIKLKVANLLEVMIRIHG